MTIGAGQRRENITFQSTNEARDSLGVMADGTWADIGTRLASVRFGSSGERREAAVEQATQAITFRVLADTLAETITAQDRISWDGLAFDITGIARIRPPAGAAEIEFTATASRG